MAGGGPAGSACAFRLASRGVRCLLLDGAVFPRDKTCGGALSHRGAALLLSSGMLTRRELRSLTLAARTSLDLYRRDELLCSCDAGGPPVRLVSRRDFDALLLRRAEEAGAALRQGEAVLEVRPGEVTTSLGRSLGWSFLVGADGARSVVRRSIGAGSGRGLGLGMEVFLPMERVPPGIRDRLGIRFGDIPYGYCWTFPGADSLCAGAGAVGSPASGADVRAGLERLLGSIGAGPLQTRPAGAPIPSLSLHRRMGRGRVYLAGDAAGLVDQVSGEGISHALESGMLVADAIAGGGERGRMLAEARAGCMGVVGESTLFRHLLFGRALQPSALRRLSGSRKFAEGYWRLISGKVGYRQLMSELLLGSR